MIKKTFLLFLAVAASAFSQKPPEPVRPDAPLQFQVDPAGAATPSFKGVPAAPSRPADEIAETSPQKKPKGATQIDSDEVTFDQKKNEAIFIGNVVVKDPEFNVVCDKLTALLKSAEKAKPAGDAPVSRPPKSATPAPGAAAKKGSSGLQKAIAEANPGSRVTITQDKADADGTVQHSLGKSDKATYDAVTGDIVLTGSPQIQQGINLILATSPTTVMTLNRDGHMNAKGPTKTVIVDKGDAGL